MEEVVILFAINAGLIGYAVYVFISDPLRFDAGVLLAIISLSLLFVLNLIFGLGIWKGLLK